MLGRLAVPMFFAISGFLFFRNAETMQIVLKKRRRRVRTILIPYILAALFLPCVFLILKLSGALDFLVSKSFSYLSDPWWMLLCRVFLFNLPDNVPFAVQLWFLRDLLIVVFFTPVLWMLKQTRFGLEVLMAIMFVLSLFDLKYLPIKAFFWFCFGVKYLPKVRKGSWVTVGIVLFCIVSLLQMFFHHEGWRYFEIPIIALGLVSLWSVYDKLIPESFSLESHKKLDRLCESTFFIYLYHLPLLLIVGNSIMLVYRSELTCIFAYLVSPWITILCLLAIALLLHRYLPKFYSVLVGGRVFNRGILA
jgi:surface polysaccharide O-acyltransferase-like enzyme